MRWATKRTKRRATYPEAEGHYLRAVELDPNFAMAYARLGVVYVNSGQWSKANKYFAKAYALSKNVSERERLYIAGHYYQNVTGDIPKVIETLQESIQTYPGQLDSYININVAYQTLGQLEQALPYAQKAVEIQPEDAIASENLLADYIGLVTAERCQGGDGAGAQARSGWQHGLCGNQFHCLFFLGRAERDAKDAGPGGGAAG